MNGGLARSAAKSEAQLDAERWGIPWTEPEDGVWPQNAPAVEAFLRVRTLFRAPGAFGGPCGLDYGGVPNGLTLAGIEVTPELWAQIQAIEAGAIDAVMERRS